MANSKKVEEKYQRILKECQKRQENRTCFDCNSRGNQYVVLNLNVFVCTTCSGIHREINHRVKSVGMSTFTTDEIKAIDKAGNAVGNASWMARYNPSENQIPPESDIEKIRAFMKIKCAEPLRPRSAHCRPRAPPTLCCFRRAESTARARVPPVASHTNPELPLRPSLPGTSRSAGSRRRPSPRRPHPQCSPCPPSSAKAPPSSWSALPGRRPRLRLRRRHPPSRHRSVAEALPTSGPRSTRRHPLRRHPLRRHPRRPT